MSHFSARVAALASLLLTAVLAPAAPAPAAVPTLDVATVVGGLDQPWDVKQLPDGSLLVTERDSRRLLRVVDGRATPVAYAADTVWVSGETGLMGLEVDPDFAQNRRFYTCQGGFAPERPGGHDVRVMAWQLAADGGSAAALGPLVTGIPASSGRHGGCRLLVGSGGELFVGTGDAARTGNPRSLRSLGGKVLRVDRFTGAPVKGNPFARSRSKAARLVWTYGHRNVQGLAQRGGVTWSVEQGTSRDDEVNRLVRRGDYGWQPGRGYDESAPMTNQRLRGKQRAAAWRSGRSTLATSGATFVTGARWGDLDGTLAVAALKGQRMLFLRFGARDRLRGVTTPAELQRYGRLRSVTQAADGTLLVTTANGDGRDRVLRVTPRG